MKIIVQGKITKYYPCKKKFKSVKTIGTLIEKPDITIQDFFDVFCVYQQKVMKKFSCTYDIQASLCGDGAEELFDVVQYAIISCDRVKEKVYTTYNFTFKIV